jgi:hypothetical protein
MKNNFSKEKIKISQKNNANNGCAEIINITENNCFNQSGNK